MTQYMISFGYDAMDFPEEDLPEVTAAAAAVVSEAEAAGVWVYGAGLKERDATVVSADGSVVEHVYPASESRLGGFAVVDVRTRADAIEWAEKIAVACRCAQDVREILPDPGQ